MHVSEVAKLLSKSKRPLFHIGQGVRHASQDFTDLSERLQVPFVSARNANDLFGWEHPLYVGRPGTFAQRGANFAVQTCDLYVAIGTRLSLTQTGYNSQDYARNAQIVQVDIDQAELDKGTLRDPIKICMDAGEFIRKLRYEAVPVPEWEAWTRQCQAWKEKYPVCLPEYKEEKGFVNSFYFLDTLSDLSREDDVIVTDMGFAFQNTHQTWKTKKGQRLLTNCGLAPMGWGLPAAVGAAFGSGRRVLAIVGEGGLMMNIQELATIAHHKLNVKVFVLNNGGYLTIKQTQEFGFEGRLMGVNKDTGLSFPEFSGIAYAHGFNGRYLYIKNHDSFPDINAFLPTSGPFIFEINMNPNQVQAPRAVNRRNPDGTMNPTKLEDSFPFLDPEEVAEQMRIANA